MEWIVCVQIGKIEEEQSRMRLVDGVTKSQLGNQFGQIIRVHLAKWCKWWSRRCGELNDAIKSDCRCCLNHNVGLLLNTQPLVRK